MHLHSHLDLPILGHYTYLYDKADANPGLTLAAGQEATGRRDKQQSTVRGETIPIRRVETLTQRENKDKLASLHRACCGVFDEGGRMSWSGRQSIPSATPDPPSNAPQSSKHHQTRPQWLIRLKRYSNDSMSMGISCVRV